MLYQEPSLQDLESVLIFRPSRIRTYIRNLEGFCPNPLDDRPLIGSKIQNRKRP